MSGYAAAVAAAAALIGAGVTAASAIQQGQAAEDAAKFQSEINLQEAERERQIAEANEASFRKEQAGLQAKRRAILGGSSVDFSTGSPLLVTEDFANEVEVEALRVRNTGEVNATRLEQQSVLTLAAGANAASAANLRAGASLLSGIGTAAPDVLTAVNAFSTKPPPKS